MARTVRLDQLRSDARLYADQRPGGTDSFITDTELNRMINQELSRLYGMLVAARGHEYYISDHTFSTVVDQRTYALPADFFEAITLSILWGTRDVEDVRDYKQRETQVLENLATWGREAPKGYRLLGGNMDFLPVPTSVESCRLRYIPAFTDLALDGDTFDGVNGWEDAVAMGAAARMMVVEESNPQQILSMRQEVIEQIREMARDRDSEEPDRVVDVGPDRETASWFYGLPRA